MPAAGIPTLCRARDLMIVLRTRQMPARGGVRKGPEPQLQNQKPGDLGLGRVKRGESPVEARKGADVQIAPLTWA